MLKSAARAKLRFWWGKENIPVLIIYYLCHLYQKSISDKYYFGVEMYEVQTGKITLETEQMLS